MKAVKNQMCIFYF